MSIQITADGHYCPYKPECLHMLKNENGNYLPWVFIKAWIETAIENVGKSQGQERECLGFHLRPFGVKFDLNLTSPQKMSDF